MANNRATITLILAVAIACCVSAAPKNKEDQRKTPLRKNLAADDLCTQAGGASATVDKNGFTEVEYEIQGGNPQNVVDAKRWFTVRFKVQHCANLDTHKTTAKQTPPTIDECIIDCDMAKNGGWVILECDGHGGHDKEIIAYEDIAKGKAKGKGISTPFRPVKGEDVAGKFDLTCKNWLPPSITHHV